MMRTTHSEREKHCETREGIVDWVGGLGGLLGTELDQVSKISKYLAKAEILPLATDLRVI
jgi:hypothetical protein